jgi:hypothetical protein
LKKNALQVMNIEQLIKRRTPNKTDFYLIKKKEVDSEIKMDGYCIAYEISSGKQGILGLVYRHIISKNISISNPNVEFIPLTEIEGRIKLKSFITDAYADEIELTRLELIKKHFSHQILYLSYKNIIFINYYK